MKIKFAIFSDLHYDEIQDGNERIDDFLSHIKKAKAEFIVDLGNFCYPSKENNIVLNKLKSSELPCYFTIGNHNTDRFTIDEVIKFFDLKRSYYSFIKANIKFIILDYNLIKKRMELYPFIKKIMIKRPMITHIFLMKK
ncbi:metallophosphoesterase family protein [Clostridium saccharoperbutylacetonicum]|uniref:metallophosphoesterase family protein n=1 Tax=Clostridium saccharoperbutylacetonicum TaxID=36745 RepID=UPI0039EAD68A